MVRLGEGATPTGALVPATSAIHAAMEGLRSRRQMTESKPLVEEDDLRWLLDQEEHGGSLQEAAEQQEREKVLEFEETVSQLRIQLGTLRNTTLRHTAKLHAKEEELRLLQHDAIDTPQEKKAAAARAARYDATKERLEAMEALADEQAEYTLTLLMLEKRLVQAKGGGGEVLQQLRDQITELELRRNRQECANGEVVHSAWQARNGASLQLDLALRQRRTHAMLESKRKQMLASSKKEAEQKRAELQARTKRTDQKKLSANVRARRREPL